MYENMTRHMVPACQRSKDCSCPSEYENSRSSVLHENENSRFEQHREESRDDESAEEVFDNSTPRGHDKETCHFMQMLVCLL